MSAEASPHLIELIAGKTLETDYAFIDMDRTVYMARCSCGWSVVRQFEHATRNQVAKHRKQVAA